MLCSGRLEWRQSGREAEGRLVRDLVRRLLVRDTTQRLGCMKRSTLDVTEHKFYDTLDWDEVCLEFHFRLLKLRDRILYRCWRKSWPLP